MALLARSRPPGSDGRGYLSAARMQEHNQSVESNLEPWMVPLWRRHRYMKRPDGRAMFTGTPDHKAESFREWLESAPAEVRREVHERGEKATAKVLRQREAQPFVATPCVEPHRFRTKAVCKPTERNRPPKWSLMRAGRTIDVPCEEPFRFRNKELCFPKERRWAPPLVEEEHAFAGLI